MAKERLSKLQRWILERCVEREDKEIWRNKILLFFGAKWNPYIGEAQYFGKGKNKAEVSITNSIRNLYKKGYVDLALGHLGGYYTREDNEKYIKNKKELIKEIKRTGKKKVGILTGKTYGIEEYEEDIKYVIKNMKNNVLMDTTMGHNAHRVKLTDKGIELIKSLNIN